MASVLSAMTSVSTGKIIHAAGERSEVCCTSALALRAAQTKKRLG
jgi:hypothetical protein